MATDHFKVSDIDTEMKEIADKYIKAVLINAKRSYYRVLRKIECERMSVYDLTTKRLPVNLIGSRSLYYLR